MKLALLLEDFDAGDLNRALIYVDDAAEAYGDGESIALYPRTQSISSQWLDVLMGSYYEMPDYDPADHAGLDHPLQQYLKSERPCLALWSFPDPLPILNDDGTLVRP